MQVRFDLCSLANNEQFAPVEGAMSSEECLTYTTGSPIGAATLKGGSVGIRECGANERYVAGLLTHTETSSEMMMFWYLQ